MTKVSVKDEDLVAMGEIVVRRGGGPLRTLLGSCIGVAIFERRLQLVGLAHIVMPDSMGRSYALGKYADTAIPEIIRQLTILAKVKRLELTAKIAGGANMFSTPSSSSTTTIGEQNSMVVEDILKELRIPLLAKHLGGNAGRRMLVQAINGVVQIHVVGQPMIEI